MGRIRSLATQTPAVAISVLAVALSLGGGAYASTLAARHSPGTSHTALTSGVSWNSLSLVNGWSSDNATQSSGKPRVAIQSNIVYLSGSLHQPSPGGDEFAVLPSSFRPAHNMRITVYTSGDTSGTLYIGKDGVIEAYSATGCGPGNTAQCYTSLAGISYPVNS